MVRLFPAPLEWPEIDHPGDDEEQMCNLISGVAELHSREGYLPKLRHVNLRSWSVYHGCDDEMDRASAAFEEAGVEYEEPSHDAYDDGYDGYDSYTARVEEIIERPAIYEGAEPPYSSKSNLTTTGTSSRTGVSGA